MWLERILVNCLLLIKITHRGSFGDLSNKEQYFHIEPIERHPDSVISKTEIDTYTL